MPIRLTSEEAAFVERVRGYCRENLTEPEMARQEEMSISGLRQKLQRCSFEIEKHVTRTLVRIRTGEPYDRLMAEGEIVVDEPSADSAPAEADLPLLGEPCEVAP